MSGWLSIGEDESGVKTYSLLYMPAQKKNGDNLKSGKDPYLLALECAYHLIFQINLDTQTLECIHGRDAGMGQLYDLHVTIDTAKSFWLNHYIVQEDRAQMSDFIERMIHPKEWQDASVIQDEFRIRWMNQKIYLFLGVAVQLDASTILFCCRKLARMNTASTMYLKDHPRINSTASSNWKIYEPDLETESAEAPATESDKLFAEKNDIFARTFGHFDLFVRGTPVIFSGPKEKELMALLIDRKGGTLSTNEAISYLWPDEEPSKTLASRYRKLASKLKATLQKYGIEHILINNNGIRSIDMAAVTCDCYEMLTGNEKYIKVFSNSYMTDYSWGEETLAKLWNYTQTYT
jgi:hypothetical protein